MSLRKLPLVAALAAVLLATVFLPTASVHAHPLVPTEVLEFLEQNPQASPEEIEQFYQSLPNRDQNVSTVQLLNAVNAEDATLWENFTTFVYLGITHILSGLDHVLFLFSLILVYVSLRQTLKLVTAFTLAHTLTFIIAGTHVISVSPRIVEPLIALSISYMALTTVFLRKREFFAGTLSKVLVVFAFGLFHGLGFAGLLEEFTIPAGRFLESLIFFNVGIEIGQLLILACVIPIITIIAQYPWYPRFQQVAAVLLSLAGLFWFVERVIA